MKHFKKTIFEDDETEAVILLDASKAFDQLHACSPQPANEGYVHTSLPFSLATKKKFLDNIEVRSTTGMNQERVYWKLKLLQKENVFWFLRLEVTLFVKNMPVIK